MDVLADDVWVVTQQLRYLKKQIPMINGETGVFSVVLQQRWISNSGKVKWVDVPTVETE